jgi:hypothetical protein
LAKLSSLARNVDNIHAVRARPVLIYLKRAGIPADFRAEIESRYIAVREPLDER